MSLIAWWPLNGDLKNKIDSNNLTATDSSTNTVNNAGKIGQTYLSTSFTSGSLLSEKMFYLGKNQSMFCWICFTNLCSASNLSAIMGQHRYAYSKGMNMGLTMKYVSSTTGYLSVNTATTSGRTYNTYCGETLLQANIWYHVGYTYDGSTIRLYVNGELDGSHSFTGQVFAKDYFGAYMWSLSGSTIGTRGAHGNYITKGKINDIRVYNHTLTTKEIQELSKGLVAHYGFNNLSGDEIFTNLSNFTNCSSITDGVRINWSSSQPDTYFGIGPYAMAGGIPSNTEFLLTFNCSGLTVENQVAFYISNLSAWPVSIKNGYNVVRFNTGQGWNSETRLFLDNTGNSALTGQNFTMTNFSLQKIDKASDVSGYNRDTTSNALTFSNNAAIGDRSALFNGSTSCINIPVIKTDMFTSAYTLNFWTYPTDNGRAIFFGDHQIDDTVSTINFERKDGGAFRYYHNGSPDKTVSNLTTPINTWTMVTVTYTPGTMKFYKNGTLVETYSHTATITKKNGGIMRIGRDNRTGATALGGMVDDFRFYVTCLDGETIKELYSTRWAANKPGQVFTASVAESNSAFQITKTSINNCNTLNESGLLPTGYTPLDGVKMERVPWINTGVIFNDASIPIHISADVTPTATSGNNCLAGCGNSNWNGPVMFNFCSGKLEFGTGGYDTSPEDHGAFAANERMVVGCVVKSSEQWWYKNGERIVDIDSRTQPTTTAPLYIGTFKTPSGSVGSTNSFRGWIHGFEIKYGDIHKRFIPCKNGSVIGMYDVINHVFYPPIDGTYAAGKTVISQDSGGSLYCNEFNEI